MLAVLTASAATFFATIGPVDVAAVFAALTGTMDARARRRTALKATAIGGGVLILFALAGDAILRGLGISLYALRAGGGILLLLIGIDMVFARSSGATSTTDEEEAEAQGRQDIAVFPLGTPLVAGPGAIGAVILLMAEAKGDLALQAMVLGALVGVLLLTLVCMLLATRLQRLLGVTGMHVIERVFGVLLTALAMQFIFDGIRGSGLLGA
jgi:multiple antibiotic resistance protein